VSRALSIAKPVMLKSRPFLESGCEDAQRFEKSGQISGTRKMALIFPSSSVLSMVLEIDFRFFRSL
jgi:hypothetical protein